MRKMIVMAAMLLASLPFVHAQDTAKVRIKPYGFVRNYLNVDSRRMVTVCGGEYLMIPYDEDWNMTEVQAQTYGAADERFDRNAVAEAHLLALSTRFGLSLEGALKTAANFTLASIKETVKNPVHNWYGVDFETALPLLLRELERNR